LSVKGGLWAVAALSSQRSAFSVQRSAFSVQRLAFSVQHSAFSVQRSAFSAQRSAFSVQLHCLALSVWHKIYVPKVFSRNLLNSCLLRGLFLGSRQKSNSHVIIIMETVVQLDRSPLVDDVTVPSVLPPPDRRARIFFYSWNNIWDNKYSIIIVSWYVPRSPLAKVNESYRNRNLLFSEDEDSC
jgi:hypothetical protein